MGSLSGEEDQFFEAREDISSVSDSSSDCPENLEPDSLPGSVSHEVWIKNLGSIHERRHKFLRWMGFNMDELRRDDPVDAISQEEEVETSRMTENSGAVLRLSNFDDRFSSSHSSMSCWSSDTLELLNGTVEEDFICRIRNLDNGTEFIVDETAHDGLLGRIREVGSNRLLTLAEFEKGLGLSPLVQQVMRRESEVASNLKAARKTQKLGWLRRLGAAACVVDRQVEAGGVKSGGPYLKSGAKSQIVRTRSHKKRTKEFSALYMRQDIPAHKGSILTMRFSPDGRHLASAGEDKIVRIWQVMELERSNVFNTDPSHVYFAVDSLSELVPLHVDEERKGKYKNLRPSDSACVIFPRKIFQISETPIHEFYGHCGEILDLSWSKIKYLLSSSTDKTVRLWQVGCNQCLQVFSHNNYVTCVQFNPMDDDSFISGSIDGKVRIWAIPGCQVIDWTDITEIVTAVCYRPDGKGLVVGSMTGNCRFYDSTDNRLQLYAQVCLQGKKRSPIKRVTGFQFSPGDPTRLMVTSADSQVRILDGIDVIRKYKGFHNSGSQIAASFTPDGTHLISASEDSNVYMWNYVRQDESVPHVKNNWAFERFFSNNVSVAVPWCGMTNGNSISSDPSGKMISFLSLGQHSDERMSCYCDLGESSKCRLPSPERFSLSQGFFSESLPKGSATWPEEKLPSSSPGISSKLSKSQCKFLKATCQIAHGSPNAWGLVIVTAGWDGRIRCFQNFGLPIRR